MLLALCAALALGAAASEEIVVEHPNGQVQYRYSVDDLGRLHGLYEEFRADGTPVVRAEYERDLLDGIYEEYGEDGTLRLDARYANGSMHGAWVEYDESGTQRLVATYREGVLHGDYATFHEGGEPFVATRYREGALDGDWIERSEDGTRVYEAEYANGELHGDARLVSDGERVVQQRWETGELARFDGVVPFPRPAAKLVSALDAIQAEPEDARFDSEADPAAPERAAALRRLQAYRHLCGLPHEEMELVPEWNELCDAASEVCEANGGLDHTPPRPPGFDPERYRQGYRGASNSNLSVGQDMPGSVDGYMDDSDPSNIERVGHRRWCLNPPLEKTGFGRSGRYAAMWSMDQSGSMPGGLDAIHYPPRGWTPTDMFDARHAWCVGVLRGGTPQEGEVRVRVRPLDERFLPGDALELDHLGIAPGGIGSGTFVVFRPVGVVVEPGSAYSVELSTDGGKSIAYRYVVGFCEPTAGAAAGR